MALMTPVDSSSHTFLLFVIPGAASRSEGDSDNATVQHSNSGCLAPVTYAMELTFMASTTTAPRHQLKYVQPSPPPVQNPDSELAHTLDRRPRASARRISAMSRMRGSTTTSPPAVFTAEPSRDLYVHCESSRGICDLDCGGHVSVPGPVQRPQSISEDEDECACFDASDAQV
ncbi:hypothetical protein V8D89_001911 [Ganoderma adspersum]